MFKRNGFFSAIYPYFTVIAVILISTFVLWLPFILKANSWFGLKIQDSNFLQVYKHFDGPLYVIPAKTLYQFNLLEKLGPYVALPANYFAAHLPLYPVLIRLFAPMLGYLKSMIFVNLLATMALGCLFYFFIKYFRLSQKPLLLTGVFLFLPRFLIIRSVGAPESLFLFLILLSILFFEKEKYWLAGFFGGLAVMTKTPGILLFVAYSLVFLEKIIREKKIKRQWLGIFLIPLGLLAVFCLYYFQFHDFLAYFHSGDNIHLVFPFSVFNFQKTWVGTAWLEDVIFYFFLYLLTIFSLSKTKLRSFFYFGLVFLTATLFVQHRDIARYSLPLWPLACIAFEKFFTSKKFLIISLILLPGIYLFAWNFMLYNVMPIADWLPFL
jgi:Gpi18-like mannosyltransferase